VSLPNQPNATVRGLLDVTQFCVSDAVACTSETFLRGVGEKGFEGLVLWAGRRREGALETVDVLDFITPEQTLMRGPDGVGLTVDGDELFRINTELYRRRLILVGQIHSHPAEAYHSRTDDEYAVVTIPGGLSVVVPDFAKEPLEIATAAVYRLSAAGKWREVAPTAAERLLQIVSSGAIRDVEE
jgi:hypothetical protein